MFGQLALFNQKMQYRDHRALFQFVGTPVCTFAPPTRTTGTPHIRDPALTQVLSTLQDWRPAAAAYRACAQHETDPEQLARAHFGAGVAVAKLQVCFAAGSKRQNAWSEMPKPRHGQWCALQAPQRTVTC